MYAEVAVPLRLPALTYRVPEGAQLRPGDPVLVKVRKKELSGLVLATGTEPPAEHKFEIREIEGISDDFPRLGEETIRLLRWAADYYHCPVGEVLRVFLPPDPRPKKMELFSLSLKGSEADSPSFRGKAQRALLDRLRAQGPSALTPQERAPARRLLEGGWLQKQIVADESMPEPPPPESGEFTPTEHQAVALEEIRLAQDKAAFQTFLLQGVTGSGKTEVYIRAASHALASGKSVLVVVPEIALTPQLVSRFRSRLGQHISVLHSGISDGERSRQWHLLNQGACRVCIGARSAAFAPIKNLGLIVVDEEHDSALKQDDHLRYSARDLGDDAWKSLVGATVVLGSATPSLETYHNARDRPLPAHSAPRVAPRANRLPRGGGDRPNSKCSG
jgi:primosomal protein N' (replication factor Y) (superfamily II helicase)